MIGGVSRGGDVFAYGASDDLLEFEGAIEGEWCDPAGPVWVELRGPDDTTSNPVGLVVVATFTDAGTWALGVAPLDDEVPIPPWPIRFTETPSMPRRSAVLAITVPAGTTYSGVDD